MMPVALVCAVAKAGRIKNPAANRMWISVTQIAWAGSVFIALRVRVERQMRVERREGMRE
jgi:hypothetical protein